MGDFRPSPCRIHAPISMTDILHALENGSANWWIFIPTAILLGALHGLEPGHSKTMMAAFIIAIRGTVKDAGDVYQDAHERALQSVERLAGFGARALSLAGSDFL